MKRKFKSMLAAILCLVILFSSVPMIANAADVTSDVAMTYYAGGAWKSFNSGVAAAGDISGIKLQTGSSSYYLRYRTLNSGASGYYGYVTSNVNDYAGVETDSRVIQQLQIEAFTSTGDKISSGLVVMYRVQVDNAWLPWVSNADPEWMLSVKSKYNLSGELDKNGSYAGKQGSNIQAVEIHVYEEDNFNSASGTFSGSESADGFTYLANNSMTWSGPVNSAECGMDCIKIQTGSSKNYYLQYQTYNEGAASFYSEVSSRDSGNYAGLSGKPIQLLRIRAYSEDGVKLTSGIVVMYRTKVGNEWLPWVSNADPEYMISVKAQYNLGGTLDTSGSYAGKTGENITGVQIRIFEGQIPATNVSGLSGREYTPNISFLTNDLVNWLNFSGGGTGFQNQIAGLKIQTDKSKGYYLSYKVSTVGGGFLSPVGSNTEEWAGKEHDVYPIDRVGIQVYNSAGVKQVSGVVVMYRAYSDGKWWPWVSNADAEWMQSALMKYHLDGALDTKSGDAGVSGKQIQNLEIRIFEETDITTTTTPTGNYKIIQTPLIYQFASSTYFPTGCESASTVMALRYAGVNISMSTFVDSYLYKTSDTSDFDPNVSFGGNPRLYSGMGCYAPVIINACNKLLQGKSQTATRLYPNSMADLKPYIDNNIPVIVWATGGMKAWYYGKIIDTNGTRWIAPEHCLLLVGYDDYNYIFKDPMVNSYVTYYSKSQCEAAFAGLGKQAIIIEKSSSTTTTPPTPTAPPVKPSPPTQEYVKPSPVEESHCADPVDLSTGSHVIENNLINLFGGNQLTVTASYNSSQLVEGSMGVGWSFNFEKSLTVSENEILIYETPSVYSRYTAVSEPNVYSCATKGKSNFILTKNADGSYSLDCNKAKTECYNSIGKLISVTDKQGFITTIGYSDNLITLTDTLTGKHIYLEKNTDGKVVRLYDDDLREVVLTYSNDYLSLIKDVCGNYITYTYNDKGKIITGTDGDGVCYFTDVYNEATGRIESQRDGVAGSSPTLFNYSEDGKTVTVTDRNGKISTRIFNDDGQLVSFTDENANTTTYTYDESLNLTSTTDAKGNTESTVYNSKNLPVSKTDKNGTVTKMTYDTAGNLLSVIYSQKGDTNDDFSINIKDLVRLKKYIADNAVTINLTAADIDSDNNRNSSDLVLLRKYLIGSENRYIACKQYTYNDRNQVTASCDLRGATTVYSYDTNGMPLSKSIGGRTVSYVYTNGLLTSQTDARGNQTGYTYNGMGQMLTSTDSANNSTFYQYDNKGNLLKATNALGDSVSYTYDGNSQKVSSTDSKGNTTFYSYTGNMKLQTVSMPDKTNITYNYDGEDRLVSAIDQNGKETATVYDAAGRALRKSDAEKNTTEYEYDAVGNVIKQTNLSGGIIVNTYDAVGNILTSKDAAGNLTSYKYNAFSKLTETTNAQNGVMTNTYLASGEMISVTDALGNTVKYDYDMFGNKIRSTDANGNITKYAYDENNNLVSVTNALNNTTTSVYDCNNRLTETQDPLGNKTTYGYDVLGRQTTVTDAKGNTVTKAYDANGNILSVTDAKGKVQSAAVYDSNNKAVSVTDASGNTTTNQYDKIGNLSVTTDSLNNSESYMYNANGKMLSATNKNGKTSVADYDASGNITSLSGTLGETTNYTYDSANRLTSQSTTSGGAIQYGYNSLNLKETLTNARGQITSYTYDVSGRITGYTSPEGMASFTYDANGNILTATDRNGTIIREFDALNRVTKYTDTNGRTIQYLYDTVGNLEKLTYPDNTAVYYSYDENNNLIKAAWWDKIELEDNELPPGTIFPDDWFEGLYNNKEVSYTYDENNNVLTVTKPDGSVTTNIYDDAQRVVSSIERKADNTVIVGYEYVYDALGRILSETHLAENERYNYTYDVLSRVTERKITNLSTNVVSIEGYTYDAAGNIISSTVSTSESNFAYDSNNRLISYNGQAVTYDLDGNMLTADGMIYAYDSANRLVNAGGNAYTYDVENIRVRNLCTDSDTTYTYNTNTKLGQLLWLQKSDGTITKYVYGLGLIGEETAGNFKTYHYDYRGSTTAITDENGNITDTFTYDTYGKLTTHTGTTNTPFLYNGRDGVMTDSNGLLYMRARYYNPELKRFVNADIIVGEITNSSTLNRYAYANGNPVSNIDPFGLSAEREDNTIYYGSYWGSNNPEDMNTNPMSKDELENLKWISGIDFLMGSENQYIFAWKSLAKFLSVGDTQDIVLDMIDHFLDGSGTEYTNETLTEIIKSHDSTQRYMKDFTDVFKMFLNDYNGNVSAFANGEDFKRELRNNDVFFTKYDYYGKDIIGGLTMAIHSWTESLVNITSFNIDGNNYSGTLQFIYKDNFGLDETDLNKFGALGGFRAWYILQHYVDYSGKYKPFQTSVTIDYNFSGSFN